MNIGKIIKERRIKLNLSADYVADKIGKSRATLYRYENGDMNYLLGKSSTTARTQLNNISAIADKVELMATKTALLQKNEIIDSISNRLKKALEIRNMTQADLVKKTGVGKS